MSNYNSQLQSNNTDLQTVLQALQTKAAGGAAEWSANEDAIVDGTISNYTNDRVTTIGFYAFCSRYSLTTVSFPAATTIGSYAFVDCRSLTTVSFPQVTTIGRHAFASCRSITTANFPAATAIGSNAF